MKFSERIKNQYIFKLKTLLYNLADIRTVLPVTKYVSAIQSDGSNKILNHWKNSSVFAKEEVIDTNIDKVLFLKYMLKFFGICENNN